jgi:hypothetical protein
MPDASLAQVKKFFGPRADGANSAKEFTAEWSKLPPAEQDEIEKLVGEALDN